MTQLEQQHLDAIKDIGDDWDDSFKDISGKVWEAQVILSDNFSKALASQESAKVTTQHINKYLIYLEDIRQFLDSMSDFLNDGILADKANEIEKFIKPYLKSTGC